MRRQDGQVKLYDVAQLLNEQWVFEKLEAFDPMGLESEGASDPADLGLAQFAALGHRTRAPVSRVDRRALQGHTHHPLDLLVAHPARLLLQPPAFFGCQTQRCYQPPLRVCVLPHLRRTLTGYNLFNVLTT